MNSPEQSAAVEGYESFFGLREPPFSLAPDPRFLFSSASHSAVLAQIAYAIQRREPLVVVTGEIGTGKTLLCRTVLQRLPGKTFLSVISDPLLDRDDLLKQLLEDFGVIGKDRSRIGNPTRHELVQALHAFLSSLVPIESHAVVIIDEAQHLQPDVLEQIRLLSTIGDARGTALGIILVGQSDLDKLLDRPDLRQLQQRVSRWLQVSALNRAEVQQYIEHRLSVAGQGESSASQILVFTPDAVDAVSGLSSGVPRVINLLCDRAMEDAYASRTRLVDRRFIDVAAVELGLEDQRVAVPAVNANANVSELLMEFDLLDEAIQQPRLDSVPREVETLVAAADTPARRPVTKYLVLAALVLGLGAAVLYGLRGLPPAATSSAPVAAPKPAPPSSPAASAPAASPTGVPTATATPAAGASGQPIPAPPVGGAPGAPSAPTAPSALGAAATTPRATSAQPPSPAGASSLPPATPQTAAAGRFELIVASFRTDARASAVAADVAALGLPIRRRVSDGWQQVLAGPFASRSEAENAQDRLDSAGMTGTQIIAALP